MAIDITVAQAQIIGDVIAAVVGVGGAVLAVQGVLYAFREIRGQLGGGGDPWAGYTAADDARDRAAAASELSGGLRAAEERAIGALKAGEGQSAAYAEYLAGRAK